MVLQLVWLLLCLGWLLCGGACKQASKGVRLSRRKIEEVKRGKLEEVKRGKREKREKKQAELDVGKAGADKRDVTSKAKKLRQKNGMESVKTPIEKDSRCARAKSWLGRLVWRPRMKMEKDLEQDVMEMKETQKRVRTDSDTEIDDPVVAVEEETGPGSRQPWSPIKS